MSGVKKTWIHGWSMLNILWASLRDTYPVLMEMISISGFFLIFGKSNGAPPNRLPLLFFWPSSLTEWPSNKAYRCTLAWVTELHSRLLLSANVLIYLLPLWNKQQQNHRRYMIMVLRNNGKGKNSCGHVLSQNCFPLEFLHLSTAQMTEPEIPSEWHSSR